jgi:hypothetical protein
MPDAQPGDTLLAAAPWLYILICLFSFGFLVLFAYQNKRASAFTMLLAAGLSASFAHLDHFSQIAITANGLVAQL